LALETLAEAIKDDNQALIFTSKTGKALADRALTAAVNGKHACVRKSGRVQEARLPDSIGAGSQRRVAMAYCVTVADFSDSVKEIYET